MSKLLPVTLTVNGEAYTRQVPANRTLLEFIREDLGLTGTKEGCNEGECGACTVIFNDRPVNACLVLAAEADGGTVLTVEGLQQGETLHPLQAAFAELGAVQCGYCIPGTLLSAKALLDRYPDPTEDQIRRGIEGNICRCAGYDRIAKAIKAASALLREDEQQQK